MFTFNSLWISDDLDGFGFRRAIIYENVYGHFFMNINYFYTVYIPISSSILLHISLKLPRFRTLARKCIEQFFSITTSYHFRSGLQKLQDGLELSKKHVGCTEYAEFIYCAHLFQRTTTFIVLRTKALVW